MGRGKELLKKITGILREELEELPDNAVYIPLRKVTPQEVLSFVEKTFDNKDLDKRKQKRVHELKEELRKEISAAI